MAEARMSTRILHVLGTAQPAGTGAVRILASLAGALDRERYRLHAWFLLADGPLVRELQRAGVAAEFVPWLPSPRDPLGAWRFWRKLRREPFAIVHQHFGGPRVRWVVRRAGAAAIVLHLHGRVAETPLPTFITLPTRHADAVIAVSRAVAARADHPAQVIYPGVPVPDQPRPPIAAGELIVGTGGRLIALKAVTDLVQAFAALTADFPAARLEIAGSGPEEARILDLARRLDVADQVRLLGWQSDMVPLLARWSLYAQPSREEGFPIATLEAMAAGLPVVATDVGGTSELVTDGTTGRLVPAGDTGALAAALRELLAHPQQRARLGMNARQRVEQTFSAVRMAREIAEVYAACLAREPRPPAP